MVHPEIPDIENAILKRLGDAPFVAEGKNAVKVLEKAYDAVHSATLRKAAE